MRSDIKTILAISILTLVVIAGGIIFLTRPPQKISTSLVLSDSHSTATSSSSLVTLVEFGDYQCPACGAYHPLVKDLLAKFSPQLNFVFRNFPLEAHKNGFISAQAAEAAGLQGKFWQMHDLLYEKQADWSGSDKPKEIFVGYAKDLQLDVDKFSKDLDSNEILSRVNTDLQDGNKIGINSTPTFFINGEKINNPGSAQDFETIIKAAILKAPLPPPTGEAFHAHFDIKIYEGGKMIDLSQSQYQSPEGAELDEFIHLHDGNADVVHIHKAGETLGDLFKSLKLQFPSNTLLYVNGKPVTTFADYAPADIDRVLVTDPDTSGTVLQKQIDSVTDLACIYSEKCPQRGKPPTESCVGGLGTGCK